MSTPANLWSTSEWKACCWWRTQRAAISTQPEVKSDMGWCHGQLNADSRCKKKKKACDGVDIDGQKESRLLASPPVDGRRVSCCSTWEWWRKQPPISPWVSSKSVHEMEKTPHLHDTCGVWRGRLWLSVNINLRFTSRFYPSATVLTVCQVSFRGNIFGMRSNDTRGQFSFTSQSASVLWN